MVIRPVSIIQNFLLEDGQVLNNVNPKPTYLGVMRDNPGVFVMLPISPCFIVTHLVLIAAMNRRTGDDF